MTLPSGTRLGQYEILSQLGKGGMGEVYLAKDPRLNRKIALKVLPVELAANQDRMRRFEQEAKAAAALNHPNVAHVYEIGEADGLPFIAMEYVEGNTLREKIHYENLELKKLLKYLQQVASGLAKAHTAGIVHRDLKPDNVMISNDGYAKILDFGLAKLIEIPAAGPEGETTSDAPTVAQMQYSVPGRLMGTVGYMSPEQAQGKHGELDHRSDIFSFGCMLYEAVTRQRPFQGESNVASLYKIVYEPARNITEFDPSAPSELQRIIRRCLAKDKEDRYQTIQDVAIELRDLRRELESDTQLDASIAQSAFGTPGLSSQGVRRPAGPTIGGSETIGGSQTIGPTAAATAPGAQPTSSAEYIVTGFKRHKTGAILIAVLATVSIVVLIIFLNSSSTRALTERDTILLTDFVNTTGDPVFDGTLKQALAVQLGQSPFLNIFSEDRLREALKFMGRSPDDRVTRDMGREICQRAANFRRACQSGDGVLGTGCPRRLRGTGSNSGGPLRDQNRDDIVYLTGAQIACQVGKPRTSTPQRTGRCQLSGRIGSTAGAFVHIEFQRGRLHHFLFLHGLHQACRHQNRNCQFHCVSPEAAIGAITSAVPLPVTRASNNLPDFGFRSLTIEPSAALPSARASICNRAPPAATSTRTSSPRPTA